MQTAIATVCLSGTLNEKLDAIVYVVELERQVSHDLYGAPLELKWMQQVIELRKPKAESL